MTPAARLQAAIEVLDEVISSARDGGPPADSLVTRYFKHRRYAGSKDRRSGPRSGRAAIAGAIRSSTRTRPTGRSRASGRCRPRTGMAGKRVAAVRARERVAGIAGAGTARLANQYSADNARRAAEPISTREADAA